MLRAAQRLSGRLAEPATLDFVSLNPLVDNARASFQARAATPC